MLGESSVSCSGGTTTTLRSEGDVVMRVSTNTTAVSSRRQCPPRAPAAVAASRLRRTFSDMAQTVASFSANTKPAPSSSRKSLPYAMIKIIFYRLRREERIQDRRRPDLFESHRNAASVLRSRTGQSRGARRCHIAQSLVEHPSPSPSGATSCTCIGIWPTAWVEQLRQGSYSRMPCSMRLRMPSLNSLPLT